MTRIVPGEQSSHRHAHSRQDEFIYVLEGEVTLETNSGQQILSAAMCAGFPAGTGDGHRFINHSWSSVIAPQMTRSPIPTSTCVSNLSRTAPAASPQGRDALFAYAPRGGELWPVPNTRRLC
jgi:hypothetical protein